MTDIKFYENEIDLDERCNATEANVNLTKEQILFLAPILAQVAEVSKSGRVNLTLGQVILTNGGAVLRVKYFKDEQAQRIYAGIRAALESEGVK